MILNYTLPYPPSVNTYWRHPSRGPLAGRHLISQEGRAYREAIRAHVRRDLLGDHRALAPWLPPGELVFYRMDETWAAPDWQSLGQSDTVFAVYWDVGERPDDAPTLPTPSRVRLL